MKKDDFPYKKHIRYGHSEDSTEGGNEEIIEHPLEKNSIETDRGTAIRHVYNDNHPTPEKNY